MRTMTKQHFFALIKPIREDFMTNPNDEDNKIMSDHFMFLKGLLEEGKLFLAGPTLIETDPMGVYILETETEEEARALMEKDPAIIAGIQKVIDFRPMRVSLYKNQN